MKKKHWHVYSGEDGESHIHQVEVDLQLADYAPPAPPVYISIPTAATRFLFVMLPKGWEGDFHPTPGRQLQVVLAGSVEGETSDGAVGRAEPGDVLVLEDTHGRGHRSRVVGDRALEILAVTLP